MLLCYSIYRLSPYDIFVIQLVPKGKADEDENVLAEDVELYSEGSLLLITPAPD